MISQLLIDYLMSAAYLFVTRGDEYMLSPMVMAVGPLYTSCYHQMTSQTTWVVGISTTAHFLMVVIDPCE